MADKIIMLSLVLIIISSFTIFVLEFFLPLSAKSNMDMLCRKSILHMELRGGLISQERSALNDKLSQAGFENIVIEAVENAGFGDEISLYVEADYKYNKMISLFTRKKVSQKIIYKKNAIARKVIN